MNLSELKNMFPWPEVKPAVPEQLDKGWFCGQNMEMLRSAIREFNPLVILELGAWMGISTRFLCDNSSSETVIISVDHWLGSAEHKILEEWKADLPTLYETFLVNCWRCKHKLVPVRLSTEKAIPLLAKLGIIPGLIYVDASHDAISVENDLTNCIETFPNARIVGDDWSHLTVREGVLNALQKHMEYDLHTFQTCYEVFKC